MADIDINGPDDEQRKKKLADALVRAGLGDVKLGDLAAAATANALEYCDGDRERAAHLLGITPEQLALKLDGPHNGVMH